MNKYFHLCVSACCNNYDVSNDNEIECILCIFYQSVVEMITNKKKVNIMYTHNIKLN